MRVGFCVHWREISFHVSPQEEGRSPWFSVGAMTYRWDYDRVEGPHVWLHVGPWVSWSWKWKRESREARLRSRLEIERVSSLYPEGNPIAVVPGPPFWFEGVTIRQGPPVVFEGLGQWTGCSSGCWHLVETPCRCLCHLPPSPDWPAGTETRPATGREEALSFYGIREEAEALRSSVHRNLAEAQARAEPPLSFCADCPGRFRPQDLFIGKKSGTPLCEGCLDRRVARGAAKKPAEF